MIIRNKFNGYSADNIRIYNGDSGGGGGGGGPPPTQTQISDLPDWAKPTAQKSLAAAEALAFQKDARGNITGLQPYQAYTGERTAQFTPLQRQAFQGAGSLEAAPQLGMATGLAGTAGARALGTQFNPYQTGQFGEQAGMYMSPFIQQALEPQMREARRQSEIQRNMDQARAVGQGAFGGSRQAIVEAERQRNLGTQLGDIQARGLQSAFDQARQQFNTEQQLREQSRQYGAGLGLQGLQTALTGAGQLGQLGQQQFGQERDILNLQNQFGTQQQQQVQNILSQQYQDFLNQKRHPYQQIEFLSNILRGTPMGTVNTLYQAQPSTANQLLGAGTSLAGAYMMGGGRFAEGGLASAYAEGGSVTDDRKVESIISKLSDSQLQQARQMAMARKDADQLQLIDRELAERAAMRAAQPQAGIDTLPADNMDFADGGIVAFADGGDVERYQSRGLVYETPYDRMTRENREREERERAERLARIEAAGGNTSSYGEQMGSLGRFIDQYVPDPRDIFKTMVSAPGYGFNKDMARSPAAPISRPTEQMTPQQMEARMAARSAPPAAPGAPRANAGLDATPEAAAARKAAAPGAGAVPAPKLDLDPGKMFTDELTKLRAENRPERDMIEGLNKAREDAAKAEKADLQALHEKFADAFKGRRERLDTREAALGKMKDQNFGLALLQAGAAMMSTRGNLGQAAGAGIEAGSKQYVAGMDKLNAAKDKLADARDRLDDLQLNRDEMSARDIFKAENKIRDTALAGREALIKHVMERDKVDRETAIKTVEQLMQVGLTQFKEASATQRTKISADAAIKAAGMRGAGSMPTESKEVAAAEAAFARDPSAKALAKRLEMLAGNPQSAKYQEALRELEAIRASKYREFGLTLAAAPGAPSPGGTTSGWGKASVVNP